MNRNNDIVEKFIAHFKGSENTFLNGCCYWFAHILKTRFFSESSVDYQDIYYEPVEGHFVTKINGNYYDIRGDVTEIYSKKKKDMYPMSRLWLYDLGHYNRLMRDCARFEEAEIHEDE